MAEIWRNVVGYVGLYEVSNLGNVRNYSTRERLKPKVEAGYRKVTLCRGATDKREIRVARLVAEAFIPNIRNLPIVAHSNGDLLNDCVGNLRWTSVQRNNERVFGRYVKVLDENGNILSTHPSATKAAIAYGYTPQLVSQKCKNGKTTRNGLTFKYLDNLRRCGN